MNSKIDEEVTAEISRRVRELKAIRDEKEELEELEEIQKGELIELFKIHGLNSYEGAGIQVNLVETKLVNRLDTKKLKENAPDLYQRYLISSEQREHLRFKKIGE
ncbi:hypothetical protein [Methanolapillus ohkumae]